MRGSGFVATKLEEALAVASLVGEVALKSGGRFGFAGYDEHRLGVYWKPDTNPAKVHQLRKLTIAKWKPPVEYVASAQREPIAQRTLLRQMSALDTVATDSPILGRWVLLLRNASSLLVRRYRRSGAYKALRLFSDLLGGPSLIIILSDLQGELAGLIEGLRYAIRKGHRVIVVQIAAAWRLEENLETAYEKYAVNERVVRQLSGAGATVLDTRPQRLMESIAVTVHQKT
jgi:uncharacterized protein (DUF58 family)